MISKDSESGDGESLLARLTNGKPIKRRFVESDEGFWLSRVLHQSRWWSELWKHGTFTQ